MSLIRYTPYSLAHMQQHINQMLDQFDADVFGRSEELGGGMFTPAVDVKEDANAYIVQMEVPGVKQDNLAITLQENVLIIRGQKEQREEHAEGQFRRVERSYGSFARSLSLPRNVDANSVSANLQDGVLEIRLPKMEQAKPRQISVGNTMQSSNGATIESSTAPQSEAVGSTSEPSGPASFDNSNSSADGSSDSTVSNSGAKGSKASGTSGKAAGAGASKRSGGAGKAKS